MFTIIASNQSQSIAVNIYLVSRTDDVGYDEYDALVVCAESEEDAKTIQPSGYFDSWRSEGLKVELLGTSHRREMGVILGSFNAG